MAQVRKYAPGGIFVDGVQLTEEQINNALTGASAEARAQWAETLNAVRSGQRVDVDSNANSVVNGRWENSLTDKQLEKNTTGNLNRRQRNRHARWNTDIHNFNKNNQEIISAFKTQLNVPTETPKAEELKTTALGYGSGWFYDENGNYKGSVTGANNEKIIRDVFKYLGGDEAYRKGWTTDNYGADLNGLMNWYSGQDVEELINRIKSNSLTADDKDVLQRMGFSENPQEVAAREQNAKVSALKNQFQTAGLDYDKWSGLVEFDDKGRMVARKDANGNSVFSAFGDGNLWFNDSFVNKYKQYDFLKDHFLIDGVLYKASDAGVEGSELYNKLREQNGFYDLNKVGNYEGSNNLVEWMWGTSPYLRPDNTQHLSGNFYNSGVRIDNTNYRNADTGIAGSDYKFADGDQVIKYVDLNYDTDDYGLRNALYAIVDKFGNVREHDGMYLRGLGADYFTNLIASGALTQEDLENQQLERTERTSTDKEDRLYYNRYTVGQENPYFQLHLNNDGSDAILELKGDLTNKWLSANNKGIKVSKEVADLLQSSDFLNILQTNPGFAKKFRNSIMSMTGTDWQDFWRRNLDDYEKDSYGLTREQFNLLKKAFYDRGSNQEGQSKARQRRNMDYIVNLPKRRNGGRIVKGKTGIAGIVRNSGIKLNLDELGKQQSQTKPYVPIWEQDATSLVTNAIKDRQLELNNAAQSVYETYTNTPIMTDVARGFNAGFVDKRNAYTDYTTKSQTAYDFGNSKSQTYTDVSFKQTGNIPGEKSNFNFGQYLDPAVGAASLAYSINQTNRIADINKDTANNVAQASIISRPEMEAKRNSIIAGNAYRNQAKRQFDALPPVNSDYLKYAAMKRVGDDMANQYLLQADLADSQEYNQNQAWNSEVTARYHDAVRRIEAHNRQVEGQRLAAIGQFEVARRQANAQSINNSMYEFRNRLEQAKQAADSKKSLEGMFGLEADLKAYMDKYRPQYNLDSSKGTQTYEQWLSNKPEYMRDITDERSRLMQKWKLESVPQHWLSPLFAKSGTKLRPSKEQIEINRRKAQDQAWVNQNKATQKALAQLTKQAHEFLKMMLS